MRSRRSLGSVLARRAAILPWVPSVLMVFVAGTALIGLSTWDAWTLPSNPAWLAMIIAFGLAELTVIHFEFRKQTVSWQTSEIPMVVGLFLFGPAATLIARAVAVAAVVAQQRYRPAKAVFNVAVAVIEAALASWLILAWGFLDVASPLTWLGVIVVLLFTGSVSIGCIALAILITEGTVSRGFWVTFLVPLFVIVPMSAAVAIVVLLLIEVSAWAVILAVVMLTAFVLLYRRYAAEAQDRRSLSVVYQFAEMVQSAAGRDDGGLLVLEAIRERFNAVRASLWTPAYLDEAAAVLTVSEQGNVPYDGPADYDDDIRLQVLAQPGARLFARGSQSTPDELACLRRRDVQELLAVRLETETHEPGYLEVCDRNSTVLHYTKADVELLDSLANHVEAALRQRQLLSKIRYDAAHDQVTDLPNRFWLTANIDAYLDPDPINRSLGLLLADIDGFAQVNETLGHAAGDELLQVIALSLREHMPPDAQIARVGGSQFAIVLPTADLRRTEDEAERLRRAVSSRVQVAGLALTAELTVGVAVAPLHGSTAAPLLQRADVAVLAARNQGLSTLTYSSALDEQSLRRLRAGADLAEAIDNGQLTVVFQPIVDTKSGQVAAVEVLSRWAHPTLGTVRPDEFIPLAERTGLITALTRRVLATALQRGQAWLDEGVRIPVAVNLSSLSLGEPGFVDEVAEILRDRDFPAELLTFEITEGSVVGDARTLPALERLHELGIRLSIDDFGTGYSSLSYLTELPVDEVKIDKSFVKGMSTDVGTDTITRSIIDLAHRLGMRVVAEGVEHERDRELLSGMDCDFLQGYLISRPQTGTDLDAWLAGLTAPAAPSLAAQRNGGRATATATSTADH